MTSTLLVTDSTADIPAELARELAIRVVPASIAFDDETVADGTLSAAEFYERMSLAAHPPRVFGAPSTGFLAAFEASIAVSKDVIALLMPFDVSATFTAATSAVLSLDPGVQVKVVNPGVASAGLGALVLSLAAATHQGLDAQHALEWIDANGPRCDTVFIPGTTGHLARTGRLALIEQKTGPVDDRYLLARVGTRISGLALADTEEAALREAVALAGRRAGTDTPVVVVVDHALAPARAAAMEVIARETLRVHQLVVTELSPTIGSQLGPGTAGIGVAPAAVERRSDDA